MPTLMAVWFMFALPGDAQHSRVVSETDCSLVMPVPPSGLPLPGQFLNLGGVCLPVADSAPADDPAALPFVDVQLTAVGDTYEEQAENINQQMMALSGLVTSLEHLLIVKVRNWDLPWT